MRREPSQIHQLIIHCTATPNGRAFTTVDIDEWHRQRGFARRSEDIVRHEPRLKHIGYHYVILLSGGLANGRHELEIGAHCAGHNADSVGVCLVGTDRFLPAQWITLCDFVKSFLRRYPTATVHGHREFAAKSCPGFDVQDWLAQGMPAGHEGHVFVPPRPPGAGR